MPQFMVHYATSLYRGRIIVLHSICPSVYPSVRPSHTSDFLEIGKPKKLVIFVEICRCAAAQE